MKQPGQHVGPYQIVTLLGCGAMGEVYRARDLRLRREVALKVLPEETVAEPSFAARFEEEARAVSAIDHPNVVAVHDVGRDGPTAWMALELVEGRTLRELVEPGPLPAPRALALAAQIADGLAAAHERGVVHRDLKPENVKVTAEGRVKLLDFGLAKLGGVSAQAPAPAAIEGALTTPGMVLGTVGYMSPEQAAGRPADFRSDQFALGTLLFEMLCGRPPFRRPTAAETLFAIIREEMPPLPPLDPALQVPLHWVLERCLAKDPGARYGSTRDLARDLHRLGDHFERGSEARPRAVAARRLPRLRARTLAAGLAVAAAGALGLAAGLRMGERSPPLFQQLTFGRGHVTSARFAPDGATIVYSAGWDGAPFILYRKDPQGAGSLPLQLPAGWLQAVSPRGTALVVTGARGAPLQVVLPGRPVGTLAEGPLDGGAARELLEEVQFADWDPGGSSMVVVHEQAARTVLQLPPGHTLFATSGWISYPRVSRAGDLVAFLEHPVRGVERGRVIVIDRQGTEKLRTPMWAVTKGLAWSPRGNEVWFGASPGEALRSIYAVGLDGRTRLLLRGPGPLALHDVAASGDALVARETRHIGIAALLPSGAVRDLSWMDAALIGDLSDDGSTLLFTEFGEAGGLYYSTYSRSISGSPAMRLGDGFASALSPDGAMALALIPKLPPELVLLPTRAGPQRRVQPSGLATYHSAGFMPGGQRILIAGHEPDKGVRLYVQDLGGGRPRAISPEHLLFTDHYNGFPVSPDGRWVAAADWQGEIDLHATDGTLTRVVHGLGPGTLPIRWTRDGRGLYAFRPHEVPARIMRLDVAEAAPPREWLRIAPADPAGVHIFPALRLSADGRTCVYSYVRLLTELYLVKGLR